MDFNQELLLIDKPRGITSFDVIRRLRRLYSNQHAGTRAPKMGHAGTLDPLASGLMLVGVGHGTKQLASLIKLDKEYVAEICIGESRTTSDMEGAITDVLAVTETIAATVEKTAVTALRTLRGIVSLPVSAYSAIKVDGVPMYKRARQAALTGDSVVAVPVREMVIKETELLAVGYEQERLYLTVRFVVGSGTYIRSLAEELGRRIGYPAYLSNLRRTQVGTYRIEDARAID